MKQITNLILELSKSPEAIKMIACLPIEFYSFDYLDKTFDKSIVNNYNEYQLKRKIADHIPCWMIVPKNQGDLDNADLYESVELSITYLLIFRTLNNYWKGKLYSYNKKSAERVYYPEYGVSVSEMREIKKLKKALNNNIMNFL